MKRTLCKLAVLGMPAMLVLALALIGGCGAGEGGAQNANQSYTVAYDGNGNDGGSVPLDSTNYEQGQTVTVLGDTSNLVKSGYTFAGWNMQSDGNGTTYAQGATFSMGSANVTLFAKWTANPTFTVTYNGNSNTGGSVPVAPSNYEQGQVVTLLGNTSNLVKTGYSFAGWNTQADGNGTSYTQTQTFVMSSANVTLYAKWKKAAISIPRTGQTTIYAPGDDGSLQKGAVWPDWPNYRFTNADGTTPIRGSAVIDQLTGLMWTKDGNAPGPAACDPGTSKAWQAALDYVACLNANGYLGHTDWRLPNINELESLSNLESHGQWMNAWLNTQGFVNVQGFFYWSSTTNAGNTTQAWFVFMGDGSLSTYNDKTVAMAVWPVRTGLTSAPALLPVTGQTTTYAAGDDGMLQNGIAWPDSRFTNPDGTVPATASVVIDRFTGLMWTRDGNAPGPSPCGPATAKTWVSALDYIACLNTNSYLGYTDWRLPNMFEMRSLINAGESNNAIWLNLQGFTHQQESYYWSSTTHQLELDMAYIVDLVSGIVARDLKTFDYGYIYVWPVRDGK